MKCKVELLTPMVTAEHSYAIGDEYETDSAEAERLIAGGLAKVKESAKKAKPEAKKHAGKAK